MQHAIDFSVSNVAVIYAPNGTMKSSFANTFKAISEGKPVVEKIYGNPSTYQITDEKGDNISAESIIVINPFDEKTYENQGLLMANTQLRNAYLSIHKNIDSSKENLYSQLKTQLGYSTRSSFDVEATMLLDWKSEKNLLFKCLQDITVLLQDPDMSCSLPADELNYNILFNEKVLTMLTTDETSELIEEYEKKYNELVEKSLFMQKGVIDHNNYANISNTLKDNGFFGAKNEITLNAKDGSQSITLKSQEELNELIKAEKNKVLNTKDLKDLFEKINKAVSKNKDTQAFNAFLQKHPDIVAEYKDIEKFKKKVWLKAFAEYEWQLTELLKEYKIAQDALKELRNKAQGETTDWNRALALFKERFFVPFSIETTNKEDVILNAEMPSFKYIFNDTNGHKVVTKDNLLEVLSTGEKRAFYILNMIFQILVAKKTGNEKLLILDDISESFDYKNKHAIIEYLNDIAGYTDNNGEKLFKIVSLTHNFDFYRTVASRLRCQMNARIAYKDSDEVKFEGGYLNSIFKSYKNSIFNGNCDNIVVATIPFVRNLIEFTEGTKHSDYIKLTSLLHYKADTKSITLKDTEDIYNNHWFRNNKACFASGRENDLIYNIIIAEADKISNIEKLSLENKVILSMAIRLKTDEYIIRQLESQVQNGSIIVSNIYNGTNQSSRLIEAYKTYVNDNDLTIFEQVSMLTPENIHLNSFMYEPILDMSLVHLYKLYQQVKQKMV